MKKVSIFMGLVLLSIIVTNCATTRANDDFGINEQYLQKLSDRWRWEAKKREGAAHVRVLMSANPQYSEKSKEEFFKAKEEFELRSSSTRKSYVVKYSDELPDGTFLIQVLEILKE